MKTRKIYDSFLFFNELDLLEIRLNLLNDVVDHFIISESDVTFSGKEKPLYFEDNKKRFEKFLPKIIHQVVRDTPDDFQNLPFCKENLENPEVEQTNKVLTFLKDAKNFPKDEKHWGRDFYQREILHRAMRNLNDEDIVIFSDIDEIPNPVTLKDILQRFPIDSIFTMRQKEYNYFINLYRNDGWMGPRVANYKTLKNLSLNKIRAIVHGDRTLVDTIDVDNGGWHFTSLGGTEKIIQKIESWGHQEFNTPKIKEKVKKQVELGGDIFLRRGIKKLTRVEVTTEHFPPYIVENQHKYSHLFNHTFVNKKDFFGVHVFRDILNRIGI